MQDSGVGDVMIMTIWLLHMSNVIHLCDVTHVCADVTHVTQEGGAGHTVNHDKLKNERHSCVWRDSWDTKRRSRKCSWYRQRAAFMSFVCVTLLSHKCDVTHVQVRRDSWDTGRRSRKRSWYRQCDLFMCCKDAFMYCIRVTWLVYTCDVAHVLAWRDSYDIGMRSQVWWGACASVVWFMVYQNALVLCGACVNVSCDSYDIDMRSQVWCGACVSVAWLIVYRNAEQET